jgi:hypothetical protein
VCRQNVRAAPTDTALSRLEERRAFLCRLTPDRALETLDDAEAFLHDRGLLTRSPDSALPSLFGACHEEPYAPSKPGFGQWPRTTWPWSFALLARPGVYAPKIHHRRKTLYVTEGTARILDPVCRAEVTRMHADDPEWARLLDHLANAGPSTADDLKTELSLKPRELKKVLYPLELCGAVVGRAVAADEQGRVEAFEYLRWDQLFPDPAPGDVERAIPELLVTAVRAAVVAPEREVPRWFPWRRRLEADVVERLVSEGRLVRPAPGWVAAAESA